MNQQLRQLLVLVTVSAALTACNAYRFALLSNLNVDPFYGAPLAHKSHYAAPCSTNTSAYVVPQCETSWSLLSSVVDDVASLPTRVDTVLIAGDLVRHAPPPTMDIANVSDHVVAAFAAPWANRGTRFVRPHSVFVHGSHDVTLDRVKARYRNGSFPAVWENFLFERDEVAFEHFATRGYFSRLIAGVNVTILALDTNLWIQAPAAKGAPAGPGDAQIAWMTEVLGNLNPASDAAFIVGHEPPVGYRIESYVTWRPETTYHSGFGLMYADVVRNFSNVIVAQLFGGLHVSQFSAASDLGGVPVVVTGSVSPIYGINPVYTVIDYDPVTRRLTGFGLRQLAFPSHNVSSPLWEWGAAMPTSFADPEAQEPRVIDSIVLLDVARRIDLNATLLDALAVYSYGGMMAEAKRHECEPDCIMLRRCALTHATDAALTKCIAGYHSLSQNQLFIRFFALFSLAVVIAAALTCVARSTAADEEALAALVRQSPQQQQKRREEDADDADEKPLPPQSTFVVHSNVRESACHSSL